MEVEEEVLDSDEIQGNVLAGFNKDYQTFLFLRLPSDGQGLAGVRGWLLAIAGQLSSLADVGQFNRRFSERRRSLGADPPDLVATWMNVAFSAAALRVLTGAAEVDQFVDQFFKDGLHLRSGDLRDPVNEESPGHPKNWVVGGPDNEADILLIVASDSRDELLVRLQELKADLPPGVAVLWEQPGETLDEPLTGHEHFGFKDGISQPGVRGLLPGASGTFLTPRLFVGGAKRFAPLGPDFAKPGQPLVWTGQFVFGYLRQSVSDTLRPPDPPHDKAMGCPWWGANGSFLVLRRLRQNVPAFRRFMRSTASRLAGEPGFGGMSATRLASLCVGRWPSGAPLMRAPAADDANLGADPYADNFFQYVADSPAAAPLNVGPRYPGDRLAVSRRDDSGIVCPFSAHVRKVNPRDTITEQGSNTDTLTRLVLRRGVPYGAPFPGTLEADDPAQPEDDGVDRGLIFVSYQTSIEEQFVFLQSNWANDRLNPNGGGGEDPIIGQPDRGGDGVRIFNVRAPARPTRPIPIDLEWITPTGGGFFFSPAISTVRDVLGRSA